MLPPKSRHICETTDRKPVQPTPRLNIATGNISAAEQDTEYQRRLNAIEHRRGCMILSCELPTIYVTILDWVALGQ